MLFKNLCEFRGSTSNTSQKNGNVYVYANLEDENGESLKVAVDDTLDITPLIKGDKGYFYLDFNAKYNSFKLVKFEVTD